MLSWILIAFISICAAVVLYVCDLPGHRRRRQDPMYKGPERRAAGPDVDFFEQPIFRKFRCPVCDKLERDECPPEGHSETKGTT